MQRLKLGFFILALYVFASYAEPANARSCKESYESSSQRIIEKINIDLLMKRFIQKGYSVDQLRFEFAVKNEKNDQANRVVIDMSVKYENKMVLEMRFSTEGTIAKTFTGPIDLNFSGTGLGTLSYLIAAKTIYQRFGVLVSSDYVGRPEETRVSDAALKVWNRFSRQRLTKFENGQFSFTPESIDIDLEALNPIIANQTVVLGH